MSFCLTLVPADAADVGIELSNHSELCVLTHFLPRIHVVFVNTKSRVDNHG